MHRYAACLFVALTLFCRQSPAERVAPRTDLERLRSWLTEVRAGRARGAFEGVAPSGYRFHTILSASDDRTVVALSREQAGTLWLFDSGGRELRRLNVGELASAGVENLGDGELALRTTEVVARGTGVYSENYVLYAVGPHGIRPLWSGVSRDLRAPLEGDISSVAGYLRIDVRGLETGLPRLTHIVFRDGGKPVTTVLHVSHDADGSLRVTPVTP